MTDDVEAQETQRQWLEELLSSLGGKLHGLAGEQVAARQQLETRWLRGR